MKSFLTKARSMAADGLLPDPKPPRRRIGVESWYPYYAGYSENFASACLRSSSDGEEGVVLDPWNGAGTTTLVAQTQGLRSIGTDLNPVAAIVAAAKSARVEDALHILGIVEESEKRMQCRDSTTDPLARWLPAPVAGEARRLVETTLQTLCRGSDGQVLDPFSDPIPPLASFVILATMRTCVSLAGASKGSNPTWVKAGVAASVEVIDFRAAIRSNLLAMTHDLAGLADGPVPRLEIASATDLPIAKNAISLVLSSPPYCTRLDYVVSTSVELAVLGLGYRGERYDTLRRRMTGTPLSRGRALPEPKAEWGEDVTCLLESIREHPSADSGHYYYKTYWQYFDDMFRSISEIGRVLRPDCGALLVVQSSYYKEIQVDLPRLLGELGRQVGAEADVVAEFKVSRVMTTMNTKSRKYANKRSYSESVVALAF